MPGLADDFQRILDHLQAYESSECMERIQGIVSALDVLAGNPMVGRKLGKEWRELIIGRDARGYVALYRYETGIDSVFVVAVRAQRELGYAREESGSPV
jgi:Plasmid stabilisation system protein.